MFPFKKILNRFEEWPAVQSQGFIRFYFSVLTRGIAMWIFIVSTFVAYSALLMGCPWLRGFEESLHGPMIGFLAGFDIHSIFTVIFVGSIIGFAIASYMSIYVWLKNKSLYQQGVDTWYTTHPAKVFYDIGKNKFRYAFVCLMTAMISVLFFNYFLNDLFFENFTALGAFVVSYLLYGFIIGFVLSIPLYKALERAFIGGALQVRSDSNDEGAS